MIFYWVRVDGEKIRWTSVIKDHDKALDIAVNAATGINQSLDRIAVWDRDIQSKAEFLSLRIKQIEDEEGKQIAEIDLNPEVFYAQRG